MFYFGTVDSQGGWFEGGGTQFWVYKDVVLSMDWSKTRPLK